MFSLLIKYLIVFLYVSIISVQLSNSYSAKTNKYKTFPMENDKICSEVANRRVDLKKDRENALIISQTTTANHVLDWRNNWKCKFVVVSDTGLFAVIQNINFRKNSTTGECIDYVQFESRKNSFEKKFCGNWDVVNSLESQTNKHDVEDFAEFDFNGYILTTIFISKESLSEFGQMNLKIVYTKFKRCDDLYTSCKQDNEYYCILPHYFNDSIVNCPFPGCLDETSCSDLMYRRFKSEICPTNDCESQEITSNSTKIILSAVTSLIVSFAVFIICIWFCKKTTKCYDFSRTNQQSNSRVIEMQNRNEDQQVSSQQESAAPEPEKDLPPSYESLFPSR